MSKALKLPKTECPKQQNTEYPIGQPDKNIDNFWKWPIHVYMNTLYVDFEFNYSMVNELDRGEGMYRHIIKWQSSNVGEIS
jgi:hypothetical protein